MRPPEPRAGPSGGPEVFDAPGRADATARCIRCGFEVSPRAAGCRNPCANCGTVYPLGDCSD